MRTIAHNNSEVSPPLEKGKRRRASRKLPSFLRNKNEQEEFNYLLLTTMDGFRQVYGCDPERFALIRDASGKLISLECTGMVDGYG